ncbi:HPr-rel-A system PqqD family peptide chaperone [Sapientia aquatica]|uniref:HPr-rel-A system PqqD family peptide chaperone n=1 Tax=Sapientia aquatica TaxID=1549640 RepID=A0A4R5W2Z1_9BURK|nr:HPr-rel-A system PqqD family peptide chaperone [Sapientia aquatica]TDK65658.1 HPr-rel-A system PqqD family peptide chaperone [Sapientia aquatica]
MDSDKTWSTHIVSGVHLLPMSEEFVVYEPVSGNTHLLGYVAGEILQQLYQAPSNLAKLTATLAAQWQETSSPDILQAVADVLDELRAMELVECA